MSSSNVNLANGLKHAKILVWLLNHLKGEDNTDKYFVTDNAS